MKKIFFVVSALSCIGAFAQDYECATNDTTVAKIASYKNRINTILNSSKKLSNNSERVTITNVPVQIHLFQTSSGNSNISITQIRNELDSVNSLYANAGIYLFECFAPEIIMIDSVYNYSVMQQGYIFTNHHTTNVLNLYFPNSIDFFGSYVCGYSSQPPSSKDYVFVSSSCATNGSTLAHETGHYFGLAHTHTNINNIQEFVNGANCATGGDLLCDTPADPNLSNKVSSSCFYTGSALDPNNTPYNPNTALIMSYSRHSCRSIFTPMQYALMNYTLIHERNYLVCNNPTSVNANQSNQLLSIFPNPANQFLNINLSYRENAIIKIMDIQGKIVFIENSASKENQIDVSFLENGYYFLQVELKDKTISKPLVIMSQ